MRLLGRFSANRRLLLLPAMAGLALAVGWLAAPAQSASESADVAPSLPAPTPAESGPADLVAPGPTSGTDGTPAGSELDPKLDGAAEDAPMPETTKPEGRQSIVAELIGQSEEAATAFATEHGYQVRVVHRDGEDFAVTMDYRADRVNLFIADGVVFEATIG